MIIEEIEMYLDGGTIEFRTDHHDWCLDNRIKTKTPNSLYKGYPTDDNSNIVLPHHQNSMKKEILEAVEKYDAGNKAFQIHHKEQAIEILKEELNIK